MERANVLLLLQLQYKESANKAKALENILSNLKSARFLWPEALLQNCAQGLN